MTPDDELERELQSFRPRPPSPALRRGIRSRLNRRRLFAVTAGSAIAAGVVIVLLLNRPGHPPDLVIVPPAAEGLPAPSLLSYRQAAAESSEALDDLLDKQAVRSAERGPTVRANTSFLTFRGSRE
jgi:hypothetical protein